ncbi:hypothetical protein NDU88_004940 [Pleurodeles waltl]|uniref:Family with sequence similarity 98 member A n=1 Tax=Pleurodeles waltl TaxID=8319 RepID=A0AAV7MUV6_PLEWA|nr:hypothetical protein NDU88_004940 [Pleurodeles waltl]
MSLTCSAMECDTLLQGTLKALGYNGPLLDVKELQAAVTIGAACHDFACLCVWLVSEMKAVCLLEEDVSPTNGPEDADTFQLEMSGVLSELCCPYPTLTTGSVTSRLTTMENCCLLLTFLCSELQAARLLNSRQNTRPKQSEEKNDVVHKELQLIRQALGMPPAPNTPELQQLSEVEAKISEVLPIEPQSPVLKPLLKTQLEPRQWEELERISWTLRNEYECRMRMLVTRIDVTVTSFHWSERAKQGKEATMEKLFSPFRQLMHTKSQVSLSHLLAAREDMSRIVKTSSGSSRVNTSSSVNKVIMGGVPDRGGRPGEIEPPMPLWEKRREGGGHGGGRQKHWGKHKRASAVCRHPFTGVAAGVFSLSIEKNVILEAPFTAPSPSFHLNNGTSIVYVNNALTAFHQEVALLFTFFVY